MNNSTLISQVISKINNVRNSRNLDFSMLQKIKFLKSRKAVELTMNVIIIAAILLITLAVLMSFYFKQTQKIDIAFNECESKRGTCVESKTQCLQEKGTPIPFSCETQTNTCCLIIK